MVRERLTVLVYFAIAAACPGCSLVLDFSNSQIPKDAEIDAPYTLDECMFMEPNDTIDTAVVVSPGDLQGPAAICKPTAGAPEDVDFYKFNVPAGITKVTVTLSSTYRPGGDLDLLLFDPLDPGQPKAQSREFKDTEVIVCPGASPMCAALTAGNDYVFEVVPAVTGHVNAYTFSLKLE
jgi:hypothetical protein